MARGFAGERAGSASARAAPGLDKEIPDAALHAGLDRWENAKPRLILRVEGQPRVRWGTDRLASASSITSPWLGLPKRPGPALEPSDMQQTLAEV